MSQKHLQYLPAYTSSTHALDLDCLLSIYPLLPDMFNEFVWSIRHCCRDDAIVISIVFSLHSARLT